VRLQSASLRLIGSYTIQRILTAGVVLLSSLLAARILGAAVYGELAFFVFITKTISLGNLGAISGFIVHYYTRDDDSDDLWIAKFNRAYAIHLLVLAGFCFAVGSWIGSIYSFAALGFTIILPFLVLEPMARINRKFYVSLIPDLLLSFAVIGGTLTDLLFQHLNRPTVSVLWVGLIWMFVLSVSIAWAMRPALSSQKLKAHLIDWVSYRRIISSGIPRFMATCTFTVYLMIDRVFLERFYDRAELGVYMLAFQLATGATLLLSAQNLVSGIDIGEAVQKSEVSPDLLRRLLTRSLGIGGLGLVSAAVVSYFLEYHFLTGYLGLFLATFTLSVGLVAYMSAANIAELAFYRRAHRPYLIGLFVLLILGVTHNFLNMFLFHGAVTSLSAYTGIALLGYACITILYNKKICTYPRKFPHT